MFITRFFVITLCWFAIIPPANARDAMRHHHGGTLFHRFQLETQTGSSREEGSVSQWDFDGWIGGDIHKLAIKSEGNLQGNHADDAEIQALYSRNIAEFWDAQIGLRQDIQPTSTRYLTLGIAGLAPYFFETEAHLFVSQDGDSSARIKQKNDFLLTQQWIIEPFVEANFFAQDDTEQAIGAGLADATLGLQSRYEITRHIAPYLEIRYHQKIGETASLARKHGIARNDLISSIGIHWMF
jgi:copper resistance protein B